jgi:preprotein translocase subunit SecD
MNTRRTPSVPPSAGTLRVGRYFAALFVLFAVLYTIVLWPGQPKTPKLGLDLEGGTQVILKADANGKTPSKASMNLARQIISNRVNGLGVSSAEVAIQGNDRIIVSIPGKNGDSVKDIGNSFLLQFRPFMAQPIAAAPAATATPSATGKTTTPGATHAPSATASNAASASSSPSAHGRVVPKAAGSTTPAATTPAATTPAATPSASPSPSGSAATGDVQVVDQWTAYRKQFHQEPPKDAAAYSALDATHQAAVQAVQQAWDCSNKNIKPLDQTNQPLVSCDATRTTKFLLGAVIVPGTQIKSATAVAPGTNGTNFAWSINLSLKPSGQQAWAKYTSQHNEASNPGAVANTVAYTLDSTVIQYASISETITGDTSITGSFTQSEATNFANSLKYGALPLNFTTLTNSTISATLGSDQLKAGLLAGGIGLALVVIYSLLYYRALGLVTIASLLVSGGLIYAMLVILGTQIGFTLTLAGIAGFIVAVGITADSFVVFFERIKDEVHEGRTPRVAIPRAWDRSKRTILSADFVSFLAAATLYYFAAGEVRGFAFTLGMSTVLDLVVVFLFTHPIVSLFSRSAAFGSARFTGLNHMRVAGIPSYRATTRGSAAARPSDEVTEPAAAAEPTPQPVEAAPVRGKARAKVGAPKAPDSAAATAPATSDAPAKLVGEAPSEVEVDQVEPAGARVSPTPGATAAERAAARRAAQRAKTDGTEGGHR